MITDTIKNKMLADNLFYDQELAKTVTDPSVLEGAITFEDTKLSVFRIGSMLVAGQPKTKILSDYPYLNADDLKFAKMYYLKQIQKPVKKTTLEKLMGMKEKRK